jgi:hypothetical protein
MLFRLLLIVRIGWELTYVGIIEIRNTKCKGFNRKDKVWFFTIKITRGRTYKIDPLASTKDRRICYLVDKLLKSMWGYRKRIKPFLRRE